MECHEMRALRTESVQIGGMAFELLTNIEHLKH